MVCFIPSPGCKTSAEWFYSQIFAGLRESACGKKHPELRYTLQEYAEKCLVAEITRQKVDLPAVNDRAGLATYFKFHSSDYRWEHPRYKGVVLHCVDKKTAKQAKKLLKKVPEKEWEDILRKTFNTSGDEKLKSNRGFLPTEIINI